MSTELDKLPQWLSWLITYKDLFQSLSWAVASFGGFFAAMMAVRQLRQTRLWKKTELAKKILEEIWADDKCEAAMVLVDWSGRDFALNPGTRVRITRGEVLNALRTDSANLSFSTKEVFIRDCFDNLLDALQRLEHYIDRNLIVFDDVRYPLEYSVAELSGIRPAIDAYIDAYDFKHADKFLNRYDFWKRVLSRIPNDVIMPPCGSRSSTFRRGEHDS